MKTYSFKDQNQKLYFIAIVPANPVQQEIMKFKEDAKLMFQSSRSLNSPAHITVIPPFNLALSEESKLAQDISSNLGKTREIYIELNGFGHFGSKVIYVNVADNQLITDLNKKLKNGLQVYLCAEQNQNAKFHPHITVAFKDLLPEMYKTAWNYFSAIDYQRVCKIDSIELLRHENRMWKIVQSFKF
jgi:2'-5' RNA ligase